MGLCNSSEADPGVEQQTKADAARSKKLDGDIMAAANADTTVNKLLLLGPGESGKSTIFRQVAQLYTRQGMSEDERMTHSAVIINNVITAMQTLCIQLQNFGPLESDEAREAYDRFGPGVNEDGVPVWTDSGEMTQQLADDLTTLWRDPGIQDAYRNRAKFQLFDGAAYFFEHVQELAAPNWIATQEDVMHCRIRTTGIVEMKFVVDTLDFVMVDVGGQRNERKKWLHCFEGVTGVIFVAAMSEYDQMLYEDESTNRMSEALNLFEDTVNSQWFVKPAFALFLNKSDLFRAKIAQVPLKSYFPECEAGSDYEACCQFLVDQFLARKKDPSKHVYTHITCAHDQNNLHMVFSDVIDMVIRRSLADAGLV